MVEDRSRLQSKLQDLSQVLWPLMPTEQTDTLTIVHGGNMADYGAANVTHGDHMDLEFPVCSCELARRILELLGTPPVGVEHPGH